MPAHVLIENTMDASTHVSGGRRVHRNQGSSACLVCLNQALMRLRLYLVSARLEQL